MMTRAEKRRALRTGDEVALQEIAAQNPQPKKPLRVGLLSWNRHGMVKMIPLVLSGDDNSAFLERVSTGLGTMEQMTGMSVAEMTAYDLGAFQGMYGGPLNPMDLALTVLHGWAKTQGWKNFGEEVIGDMGVMTLATLLRDVLGGQFAGARSRGAEDLVDEALDEMRALPKIKRF